MRLRYYLMENGGECAMVEVSMNRGETMTVQELVPEEQIE